jgi:type IV pilus assembly protein PilC
MSLTFVYRARTQGGRLVRGTMRALDRPAALATLRERLLIPSYVESGGPAFGFAKLWRRSKPCERLAFFRAYSVLERAGIDFSNAFTLLAEQARGPRMREALAGIRADVEGRGEKLWSAMARRPDEFSDLEVAMVAAGEEAGNREEVFERLAVFLERDERLRKQLSAALAYPALVLCAATLISIYLIAFVIPEFAKLFESFGVAPSPLMGALVAAIALGSQPSLAAALLAVTGTTVWIAERTLRTSQGALAFDAFRLRLPVVGEVLRKSVLARVCRVLATLLQSGVNHVRALEVAVPVAESPVYARAIERARERIAGGVDAALEEALAAGGCFPPLLLGFVRVGASAGNIPQMLIKIAEYYEEDVESLLAALPALIQTAVTVGLGAVVATIAYLVYVPLATLSTSIR